MSHLKAKMRQIRFRLGLHPRPRWGSSQRSPRLPSWIQGALLLREGHGKGREGLGGRKGRDRKGGGQGKGGVRGKGKGREGGERKGRRERSPPPPFQIPGSAPDRCGYRLLVCTVFFGSLDSLKTQSWI